MVGICVVECQWQLVSCQQWKNRTIAEDDLNIYRVSSHSVCKDFGGISFAGAVLPSIIEIILLSNLLCVCVCFVTIFDSD